MTCQWVRPMQVATNVLDIQKLLPRARVVYCSATGVSEVGNMAYMERLGLWGIGSAFPNFESFLDRYVAPPCCLANQNCVRRAMPTARASLSSAVACHAVLTLCETYTLDLSVLLNTDALQACTASSAGSLVQVHQCFQEVQTQYCSNVYAHTSCTTD